MEKNILSMMTMIMNQEDISRFKVGQSKSGETLISVDLHKLNKKKAERLLRNTININRSPFIFRIIHGFNNGTVLKNLVNHELTHKRIQDSFINIDNPGVTYLKIA